MRINELERVVGGNPHRGIPSRQAAEHIQIDVTVKLILKYETYLSHVFPSFYVMRLNFTEEMEYPIKSQLEVNF
jgi:hypothetical protein